MRHAWALVFTVACSTNARSTAPDRVKDAEPVTTKGTHDATAVASIDAMSEGPSEEEIEEALARLSSEHGSRDIRNKEWWLKNAKYVRQRLRAMLEDGREDIMSDEWAIRILGDIGDPDYVELLAHVMTTFQGENLYWAASAALGGHPSPKATAALIDATKQPDDNRAASAAYGFGKRKNDYAARARLEELVNDTSSNKRYHAVNALAELGGSKDVLEKRRKIEKDAEVRQAISKALKKR